MIYLGIDPGKAGAIAKVGEDSYSVLDMPTNPRDLWEVLCEQREPLCEARVAVERQQSMPGQGVSSSFQTGKGFGEILGVLAASGLSYEVVSPAVWKKAFGLTRGKDEAIAAFKERSRAMARALFPDAPLSRAKDEGRAEALLLAEFLRRRERE